MSDRNFIGAIRAAPDDDTPRLVYADWLEEHGQVERGEFIRLQCRLAPGCKVCDGTGRNVLSPCPCALLCRREKALLAAHGEAWGGLPLWVLDCLWRRGFVARISCLASDWLDHSVDVPAMLAAHPIREVHFTSLDARDYGHLLGYYQNLLFLRLFRGEVALPAGHGVEHILADCWPGLTFRAPFTLWRTP